MTNGTLQLLSISLSLFALPFPFSFSFDSFHCHIARICRKKRKWKNCNNQFNLLNLIFIRVSNRSILWVFIPHTKTHLSHPPNSHYFLFTSYAASPFFTTNKKLSLRDFLQMTVKNSATPNRSLSILISI